MKFLGSNFSSEKEINKKKYKASMENEFKKIKSKLKSRPNDWALVHETDLKSHVQELHVWMEAFSLPLPFQYKVDYSGNKRLFYARYVDKS